MKLSIPLVSFALWSVVASKTMGSLADPDKQAALGSIQLEDSADVPGDSPIAHCTSETSEDLLTIEKVDLAPNPPKAGTILTIKASGVFKEKIEKGAKVHLQVKYRTYIKLVDTEADLCETMENVDLKCPLEKGRTVITKDVELPKQIPPGDYDVRADVYTKDGRKITCLTAKVEFKGGSGVFKK
ncbi:MAG: H(+)-transporting V1 sector ATPase subunit F [Chaenotheca gracillima]|nr:MAG: H(+)-transporting V1 sector ATPase subunit F [Chaenotheca gracillima]